MSNNYNTIFKWQLCTRDSKAIKTVLELAGDEALGEGWSLAVDAGRGQRWAQVLLP